MPNNYHKAGAVPVPSAVLILSIIQYKNISMNILKLLWATRNQEQKKFSQSSGEGMSQSTEREKEEIWIILHTDDRYRVLLVSLRREAWQGQPIRRIGPRITLYMREKLDAQLLRNVGRSVYERVMKIRPILPWLDLQNRTNGQARDPKSHFDAISKCYQGILGQTMA